jgi:hypothetical protein
MKKFKLIVCLLILVLFGQIGYSQQIKKLQLESTWSTAHFRKSNAPQSLKTQLSVPNDYVFQLQKINGTQNITEFQDDLGYTHERYSQYYNGKN